MSIKIRLETKDKVNFPLGGDVKFFFNGRPLIFKVISINESEHEERNMMVKNVLDDDELPDESDLYSLKDGESIYEWW